MVEASLILLLVRQKNVKDSKLKTLVQRFVAIRFLWLDVTCYVAENVFSHIYYSPKY